MFQGHGDLKLDGDHLNISFHSKDGWPNLTPKGSLKANIFFIGDEVAGPCIQLGMVTTRDDEPLDWRHSIDPLHHHGSDQFRAILHGNWRLAGRRLSAGDYSFQQSGIVYQEHPGSDEAWTLLVMADRRGNQATIARKSDEDKVFQYDDIYGAPVKGVTYPHPAGDRGLTAISTTLGDCVNGFLNGGESELVEGRAVSGVLGDVAAGPVVHILKLAPHEEALPETQWQTDIIIAVVSGDAVIGQRQYRSGELRVQSENTALPPIAAGRDGAQLVVIRADRRAGADFGQASPPSWVADAGILARRLALRPTTAATQI